MLSIRAVACLNISILPITVVTITIIAITIIITIITTITITTISRVLHAQEVGSNYWQCAPIQQPGNMTSPRSLQNPKNKLKKKKLLKFET